MAERAYGREDKAARRRVILEAAAALFACGGGELPSVAQVAVRAGLAKGTIYLYFRTKEQMFSTVLLEGWGEVFGLMEAVFGEASGPEALRRVDAFLDGLAAHVAARPELLRLDALSPNVLKADLAAEERRSLTSAYEARLAEGGAVLDRALRLAPGRGVRLLVRTYGFMRGLWRSFEELEASRAATRPPGAFAVELREALAEYWRGALGASPVEDRPQPAWP